MGGGGEGGGSRLVTFRNIAHLTAVSTMLLPFVCLSFYRSSFFFTFCYSMIANPTERYSFFMNSTEVISIQQKSRSEISDISRAQCKDPTRSEPPRVWLLFLQAGYKRALLGTKILSLIKYSCLTETKWSVPFDF